MESTTDDIIKVCCTELRDRGEESLATSIEVLANLRTMVAVQCPYEGSGYQGLRPVRHLWAEDSWCHSERSGRDSVLEKLLKKAEALGITHIFGLKYHATRQRDASGEEQNYWTIEVEADGYA